jgi:hypothetical protein
MNEAGKSESSVCSHSAAIDSFLSGRGKAWLLITEFPAESNT